MLACVGVDADIVNVLGVINNMKCIKHYAMSRFPKLGLVNELQGLHEINEKLIINYFIKNLIKMYFKMTSIKIKYNTK